MTSDDVRNVTFERAVRGYRQEDVDDFLQQVAIDMDALSAEKEDLQSKLYVLAQKVEEYRGQEETLKTALINAQRMGETVVYEAKQKADTLIRDATGKSELLRQQAEQEIKNERYMLEKLRDEVTRFKTTILSMYKQHIESFSALDAPVLRVEEFLAEYNPETQSRPRAVQVPPPTPAPQILINEVPGAPMPSAPEFTKAQKDAETTDISVVPRDVFEGAPLEEEGEKNEQHDKKNKK